MTRLSPPRDDRFQEFCAIIEDFGGVDLDGSGFWGDRRPVLTPEGYAATVATLRREGEEPTVIEAPPGQARGGATAAGRRATKTTETTGAAATEDDEPEVTR